MMSITSNLELSEKGALNINSCSLLCLPSMLLITVSSSFVYFIVGYCSSIGIYVVLLIVITCMSNYSADANSSCDLTKYKLYASLIQLNSTTLHWNTINNLDITHSDISMGSLIVQYQILHLNSKAFL